MATPFIDVIDIAMISIRDHKLDKIFIDDEETFINIMSGYLVKAVAKFATTAMTGLEYDLSEKKFVNDLDDCEKDILADWMGYLWMQDIQQDVLELRAALSDSDFRRIEQAALLKSRTAYLEYMRRKIKIDTNNYLFLHIDSIDFGGDV